MWLSSVLMGELMGLPRSDWLQVMLLWIPGRWLVKQFPCICCWCDWAQFWWVNSWDSPGLTDFRSCSSEFLADDWLSSFYWLAAKLLIGLINVMLNPSSDLPPFWLPPPPPPPPPNPTPNREHAFCNRGNMLCHVCTNNMLFCSVIKHNMLFCTLWFLCERLGGEDHTGDHADWEKIYTFTLW